MTQPGKWQRHAFKRGASHEIVVNGNPYPWRTPQRTKFGHAYKHPRLKAWQEVVGLAARSQWHGPPLEGAVHLSLVVLIARPKSHLKESGELRASAPRFCMSLRAGDRTNHLKAVEDALKGIVWVDDKQVVAGPTSKDYADGGAEPGVTLVFKEMR